MDDRSLQCRHCGSTLPEFPEMCAECAGVLRDDLAEAGAEEEEASDDQ